MASRAADSAVASSTPSCAASWSIGMPAMMSSIALMVETYCGRPDIRQASGPGWTGARTERQYADQPAEAVGGSGSALERSASTATRAASSSSVGLPLITEKTAGSARAHRTVCTLFDCTACIGAMQERYVRRGLRSHSGMFPCFLGGRVCRLVRSSRSTRVISTRVSCGLITAST